DARGGRSPSPVDLLRDAQNRAALAPVCSQRFRAGLDHMKIMLDSGAFSAWTRGEILKLDDYITFIKRYEGRLNSYINLDVIPGTRGTVPTVKEVEYAAAASLDNYKSMVAAGLRPIPVFHYGENLRWLDRLLEAGADYICLGGT